MVQNIKMKASADKCRFLVSAKVSWNSNDANKKRLRSKKLIIKVAPKKRQE